MTWRSRPLSSSNTLACCLDDKHYPVLSSFVLLNRCDLNMAFADSDHALRELEPWDEMQDVEEDGSEAEGNLDVFPSRCWWAALKLTDPALFRLNTWRRGNSPIPSDTL
jgi:hypothetical protein